MIDSQDWATDSNPKHDQTTCRRAEPRISDQVPPVWRAPEDTTGPGCGARGQRQGPAGQRGDNAPSHRSATRCRRCGGRRRTPQGQAAVPVGGGRAWVTHSDKAPLVWRAPEGPEGTGGLRGAAPNEVRPPSLAGGRARRRPKHPRGHQQHPAARTHAHAPTPSRYNKTARPHKGRAAESVSEPHRRTTMMSGSPRPLSWRTLEIPSLAATSFAVPSMRGSS